MPIPRFALSLTGAIALAIAAVGMTGCERGPTATPTAAVAPPASDPYDPAKMDFKPGPATLSVERHTGP